MKLALRLKIIVLFVLASIFGVGHSTHADDCKKVMLDRSQFLVRDQGAYGICYSMNAATLLDYFYARMFNTSAANRIQPSGLDIAVSYGVTLLRNAERHAFRTKFRAN